jgi:hypothetical protein
MSMIPCPGCGLPRVEEQINSVPCPVCAATPAPTPVLPKVQKPAAPDPTAGLASDASELHRVAAHSSTGSQLFGWAIVFFLGVGAGVGGVLGWQAAFSPPSTQRDPRLDTASNSPSESSSLSLTGPIAIAPMPHEPAPPQPSPPAPEPDPPLPDPKVIAPPADATITVELNQDVYTVPALKKGERMVLKGKVKTLRTAGLATGAFVDASALEAANIYVGGRIDGGSTLKLYAPAGVVTVAAATLGKSTVEIMAPGGTVNFSSATSGASRPGSAIDAGSKVTITARAVELHGDINGVETKVRVNLPRTGSLKITAIRGIAVVEYHVADGKGMPEVTAETVSPTATLKKVD